MKSINYRNDGHNGERGFTLIEVMIVVVIIAMLVVIAVPAYQNEANRSRRADAKISLLNSAQQLEQCLTAAGTYVGCLPAETPATFQSPQNFYSITSTTTANTYLLSAAPTVGGAQVGDAAACATLTINQQGQQLDTGAQATTCWQR